MMSLKSLKFIKKSLQGLERILRSQNARLSTATEDTLKKRREEIMARGLPKKKPIDGVRDVILVVSGKGGVGKSTTSVNLAVALAQKHDGRVGLLDADVFGPTVPLMLNLGDEQPLVNKENKMIPLVNYGVKCMSMGLLVSETSAVIWRGLMVMSAIDRLIRQVDWSNTDTLIVDTPPGTGDTLLSLIQNVPISGVIMVTTPQKPALQVTRRGATMLQKLQVPIIGLVVNMSTVQCPKCGEEVQLFDQGPQTLAKELNVPILASLPFSGTVGHGSDSGLPIVAASSDDVQARSYRVIADHVDTFLNDQQ